LRQRTIGYGEGGISAPIGFIGAGVCLDKLDV
jgi:hypothetical protein